MLQINRIRPLSKFKLFNRFFPVPVQHSYCHTLNPKMGMPLVEVVKKLKAYAPLDLAEHWDNVGLLIEPSSGATVSTILVTIDLTEDVVDEAIENKARLIISYHPNIFKPLKTISQGHWKERIISKCIKNDIAVFSPHTTWDAMQNGVHEWLANAFQYSENRPIIENKDYVGIYGVGRYITLNNSISLKNAIALIKDHVGVPYVRVGVAKHRHLDSPISTVAICAGSGASVLSGILADLYLTGEMLHHEVLEATQNGINVILCNHSDSERGFLKKFQETFKHEGLNVILSKIDKDCLETM
ncbi:unnamed protein product [Phyllotreta striolata]|uniref:NIF3-like protein 1 n=1 Tax=Phyllotreta striolata TaxID=444603 RepID=A0A9N9TVE7_PHYSR|nr:unnamed protein product [Phyllotreta striolata]